MILYIDTETRSATPIDYGLSNYASDPFFDVILVQYAIDDYVVRVWEPKESRMPLDLKMCLENEECTVVMHYSRFDRYVLAESSIANIPLNRIHDTYIQAYAHSLPGSLDHLSRLFKLGSDGKRGSGVRLIKLFSIPYGIKDGQAMFNNKHSHPKEWNEFIEYGAYDVVAMRSIYKRMPKINYPNGSEYELWLYDQKASDRGLGIDVDMAEKCKALYEKAMLKNHKEMFNITGGEVDTASKNAKIINYLKSKLDYELENTQSKTIKKKLEDPDTPQAVKEILRIKAMTGKTSPTKYATLLKHVDKNGRIHDTLQFLGASRTGRDAGRLFQPQNLMRPDMWTELDGKELDAEIEKTVELVKNGTLDLVYDDTLRVLSNLVRSVIVPAKGNKLVVADLSNIEGRTLSWLAQEKWKIQYFRDFDAGKIEFDNYVMAYSKAMNVPPQEVDRYRRLIGKVLELALGYGGGVVSIRDFANAFGLNLSDLAKAVVDTCEDRRMLDECARKYEWAKANGYDAGLSEVVYAACDYLKAHWRLAQPATFSFWASLEAAFKAAIVQEKQRIQVYGAHPKLFFYRSKSWTYLVLPSGRRICYLNAALGESITFMGNDSSIRSKQLARIETYGGKLAENAASGVARDVLFRAIPRIEKAGFKIVSRVHDELITELPVADSRDEKDLVKLMTAQHDWCKDLPLSAAGFTAMRYRGK